MKFNQELIDKTKDYFFKRFGAVLSDDKAEEYLLSLCKFGFLMLSSIEKNMTAKSILSRPRIAKQFDIGKKRAKRSARNACR